MVTGAPLSQVTGLQNSEHKPHSLCTLNLELSRSGIYAMSGECFQNVLLKGDIFMKMKILSKDLSIYYQQALPG